MCGTKCHLAENNGITPLFNYIGITCLQIFGWYGKPLFGGWVGPDKGRLVCLLLFFFSYTRTLMMNLTSLASEPYGSLENDGRPWLWIVRRCLLKLSFLVKPLLHSGHWNIFFWCRLTKVPWVFFICRFKLSFLL